MPVTDKLGRPANITLRLRGDEVVVAKGTWDAAPARSGRGAGAPPGAARDGDSPTGAAADSMLPPAAPDAGRPKHTAFRPRDLYTPDARLGVW